MSFFCLFWVLLFYFLRRSVIGVGNTGRGGVWAVLLGSITAIIHFFLGYIIVPGGFGFSRWLYGFIDLVSVPVLIPLFIYFIIFIFRGLSGNADFGNFSLLWLIPIGALRALTWSTIRDPILLVMVPLLWTALAAGISFFIHWMIKNFTWYSAVISILSILILPVAAAAAYWAFFSQQTILGFVLLVTVNIPLVLSFIFERG